MRRPTSAEEPSRRRKRRRARAFERRRARKLEDGVPTAAHSRSDAYARRRRFYQNTGAARNSPRAARPTRTPWLWRRPTAARPSRATSSRRPLTGTRGPIAPRSRCRRNSRDRPKRSGREESTASSRGASSEGGRTGTTTASSRWTTGAFPVFVNFKAPSTHHGVGLAAAGARRVHCRRRRGGDGASAGVNWWPRGAGARRGAVAAPSFL